MILITAIILSGCAGRVAVIGGPEDMLPIPKGTVIPITLHTQEGEKTINIVTEKDAFWVSKDAINRYQKARVG